VSAIIYLRCIADYVILNDRNEFGRFFKISDSLERLSIRFLLLKLNLINYNPKRRTMIRPLQDRVLVKRVEADEKTASGIIIPDTAKEKPQEGEVVAVGPGKRLDNGSIQEMGVKKGDKILFSKYGGTEVKVDDEDYIIMREDDILGVLA
jgi:chaperonin GroES